MKFSDFLNEANNIRKGTYFCFKRKDGHILYGVIINQLSNGYIAFFGDGIDVFGELRKKKFNDIKKQCVSDINDNAYMEDFCFITKEGKITEIDAPIKIFKDQEEAYDHYNERSDIWLNCVFVS